ncbi:MAG: class I SAM-dependent methyltransferase [Candidatus Sumerlaeia bacterium]|nr:class I SAM-dependent methyltransferase [Candidatus Sumerlaeia bacterium]
MVKLHIRESALARAVEFARRQRAGGRPVHLAENYHTGSGHADHFLRNVLPRLLHCGPLAGCRLLDVGTGMGFLAAMLAATEVRHVIATDSDWTAATPRSAFLVEPLQNISKQMDLSGVVSFRSGRPEYNPDRLVFVQADGARLPFCDGAFDIVFSHGCLEHVADLDRLFAEMFRVLRPGGLLYAESEKFWASRDGSHLYDIFPAPWAHLLADAETLWQIYAADHGGKDILWQGRAVDREFFVGMLTTGLNRRGVGPVKKILARSGFDLVFWQQHIRQEDRQLLAQLGVRRALAGWPIEELLTAHVAFGVRKQAGRWKGRLRLWCPWWLRRAAPEWLKRLLR